MGKNITYKILEKHLIEGDLVPGEEIAINIDHTLLQDATGTVAMLEFEAMGLDSVRVELAAQYIDHNIMQSDNKNVDDHRYLKTACKRYGIHFSQAGNGISHQIHLERFGIPGKILLGADSHTPSAAGISMIGIGAGGLDVAMAMAGRPYCLPCPRVLGVRLSGELPHWVSAKDIILEMLRRYDVKGCVGKIIEYFGPGTRSLSVTDREAIGNMGTELGATSSVFPSDENSRSFLEAQGRGEVWTELAPDENAEYDEYDEIDLSRLEPLIACPSSPGNVVAVREIAGLPVDQVIIGSCANSSFRDLMTVSKIMKGRLRHPDTYLHINPGSQQVLENIGIHDGFIPLAKAGARLHQSGCLGCIGMGQAPGTGQISLRTFPRNFPGRSGTKDDKVYLCSPETAAASALKGMITDPRTLSAVMDYPEIKEPEKYSINQSGIIFPSADYGYTEIKRGPNIRPLPEMEALPADLDAEIVIKVGDNITTDAIMPAGSRILPLRSNIDALSEFVFHEISPEFYNISKEKGNIAVVGGENYGQGSSREHAALAPRHLGVRVKIAKSFARIHKANLCNFGIIPLTFNNPGDYDLVEKGMKIRIRDVKALIARGQKDIPVECGGNIIFTSLDVSDRQRKFLMAGGALNFVRDELKG